MHTKHDRFLQMCVSLTPVWSLKVVDHAVYTLNPDLTIRAVAAEVLRRIMWGLPARRNEVLLGMAGFASRLSDDPEVSHPAPEEPPSRRALRFEVEQLELEAASSEY